MDKLGIREVNTGMFAFEGAALAHALQEVRADNAQGEHYLPDVLPIMRAHERIVGAYELSDPDELLGINDRVQLTWPPWPSATSMSATWWRA